jgi:hypothetical protein
MIGKCGIHKGDYRKTQRERIKLVPRSLPERCCRPLTRTPPLPLCRYEYTKKAGSPSLLSRLCESKRQQTCPQLQSPLFRLLPPELRRKIWRLVIGGYVLHMVRAPRKLLGVACADEHGQLLRSRYHLCWGYHYRYYTHGAPLPGCGKMLRDHSLVFKSQHV